MTNRARRAKLIVDYIECADLDDPQSIRDYLEDEHAMTIQVVAELSARGMLKPATKWPGKK